MMRSLTWKLTLIVLSVSLLSVLIVFLLARWVTVREFDRLVIGQALSDFSERVTSYYRTHGNWQGVMSALPRRDAGGPPPPPDQRPPDQPPPNQPPPAPRPNPFALLDQEGCVVVPAGAYLLGDCQPPTGPEPRTPLFIAQQHIGTVVTVQKTLGFNAIETAYLIRTKRAVLLSAIGAAVLAIILGLVVARAFIQPLRTLTTAIRAMTTGDLHQQVPIQSQDELGELARAFNQMSADLAHANQARRQMTADIAHELRNPLLVIIGYLEAMRDEVLQPTPERLATLYDEAQHLQHLVTDLRMLSLADAGKLSLQRETLLPQELLQRVYSAWQTQAQQRQIGLETLVATDLPLLHVDPERMMQVFNNLVSNALRYTPAGGSITLTAQRDAGCVLLMVTDTGKGIAADQLPLLFDRFYRADPARQDEDGASGLGLAIARSIIEAHGGRLSATSAGLGQGATFTVNLPV